jgi:hypothetical protein
MPYVSCPGYVLWNSLNSTIHISVSLPHVFPSFNPLLFSSLFLHCSQVENKIGDEERLRCACKHSVLHTLGLLNFRFLCPQVEEKAGGEKSPGEDVHADAMRMVAKVGLEGQREVRMGVR